MRVTNCHWDINLPPDVEKNSPILVRRGAQIEKLKGVWNMESRFLNMVGGKSLNILPFFLLNIFFWRAESANG